MAGDGQLTGAQDPDPWDPWDPWNLGPEESGGGGPELGAAPGDVLGEHAGGRSGVPEGSRSVQVGAEPAEEARALEEFEAISGAMIAGLEPGGPDGGPPEAGGAPLAEPAPQPDWQRRAEAEAEARRAEERHREEERLSREGEWYVVTIATYVNVYPLPDDKSTPVLGRCSRNETVHLFEWDESATWRRCRTKHAEGEGPMYGWVKVLTWKYGPLMVPVNEKAQMKELCQRDASGILGVVLDDLCQETVQSRVPEMLREKRVSRLEQLRTARCVKTPGADAPLRVDDGRLVLGPWRRPPSKATFDRVLVMGAHHTCSTALTRELEAQFCVKVENNFDTVVPERRPENHKHRVLHDPPNPHDALIVCLVKEPCFWLQSLTRHAATYAIHALRKRPDGGYEDMERHVGAMEERSQEELLDAILGTVEFLGDIYTNGGALRVWEASVRSYFDESVCPLWRTAVVRCEDFLFSFEAVMEALSELGLQRRPRPPPPDGRGAKGGVIHYKARNREEALCWYGDEAHRFIGLEPRHVQAVSRWLGGRMLDPLGYGDAAVRSWSSRPRRVFIAGSWGSYQPAPMAWNGRGFAHSLRLGRSGQESFQLLLDGGWETVIYPSVPDAGPGVDHRILGPDSSGHGKNWTIGQRDGARAGDRCNITVEVDQSGMPVLVSWAVVGGQ